MGYGIGLHLALESSKPKCNPQIIKKTQMQPLEIDLLGLHLTRIEELQTQMQPSNNQENTNATLESRSFRVAFGIGELQTQMQPSSNRENPNATLESWFFRVAFGIGELQKMQP